MKCSLWYSCSYFESLWIRKSSKCILKCQIYNCKIHIVSPRLCRCPFLRLDGGRGGGGGGGGIRVDSSVVGERAGGAGGGASRPTPVTMGDKKQRGQQAVRYQQ